MSDESQISDDQIVLAYAHVKYTGLRRSRSLADLNLLFTCVGRDGVSCVIWSHLNCDMALIQHFAEYVLVFFKLSLNSTYKSAVIGNVDICDTFVHTYDLWFGIMLNKPLAKSTIVKKQCWCNISDNYSIMFPDCPNHIRVEISPNITTAVIDKLWLTSIISGVSIKEVEYYWWLIHETNSPLYMFSVRFDVVFYSKNRTLK